jgi:hypothetical protein
MQISDACNAIKSKRRIAFRYNDAPRVVEVHTVGYTKSNKPVMRAWQVRGGSRSGNPTPWRMFDLDMIVDACVLDEKSEAPRPQYIRGDASIQRIICEV